SDRLLLLMKHPLMESSQRQEEQHKTEEDEPRQKSSDPEDIGKFGRRWRPRHCQQKKSDEDKIPECEGERQGAQRLQAEERVLVVRAKREGSASEAMDAERDAPKRPDDRRERQRRHRERQDAVDRRCKLEIGTRAGVEDERGRTGAEDRRGVDRDEEAYQEQEPGDNLG